MFLIFYVERCQSVFGYLKTLKRLLDTKKQSKKVFVKNGINEKKTKNKLNITQTCHCHQCEDRNVREVTIAC